jgi:hypothetical protein
MGVVAILWVRFYSKVSLLSGCGRYVHIMPFRTYSQFGQRCGFLSRFPVSKYSSMSALEMVG